MNKKKRSAQQNACEIIEPPAFPTPGNNIFERVGTAVSASRGYQMQNIEFAQIIGRSDSTTSHWFGVFDQPHIVSLFCLLEHLQSADRHRVVDSLCRELPLFEHSRLKHNPVAAAKLKNLLTQSTGLTLVVSGTEEQRTFLVSAMGHSYCRFDRGHRKVAGIDLHEPNWFVPIETMAYLKGPSDRPCAGESVRQIWPEIVDSKRPIVLLNGVWSILPELRKDILDLASRKLVIVADQQISVPSGAIPKEHAIHVVTVSSTRENPTWIATQTTRYQ